MASPAHRGLLTENGKRPAQSHGALSHRAYYRRTFPCSDMAVASDAGVNRLRSPWSMIRTSIDQPRVTLASSTLMFACFCEGRFGLITIRTFMSSAVRKRSRRSKLNRVSFPRRRSETSDGATPNAFAALTPVHPSASMRSRITRASSALARRSSGSLGPNAWNTLS
jgi:hypothetical protein